MPTDLAAFALAADQLFPATAPPLPLDVCDRPCCCLADEQAAMTADLPPNPTPADWCAALWLHAEDTPAELLADLAAWYHDPATSAALT